MEYLNSVFNLEKKVVIITGGSGVLGSEMARGLLCAGANVVLLGTNEKKLSEKVKDLIDSTGGNVTGLKCNVLDEDNIRDVNNEVLSRFKRIDVLINAAGGNVAGATIGVDKSVFDLEIGQFKQVTDLNINGTVLPTLIFGRSMAEQKKGSIINSSSMASQRAISRVVGYSAAKAAIENFTRWMAIELAHKFGNGLRVNAIAPGFLLTEQNRTLLTNPDGSLTDRGRQIINITPFKRFGEPNELTGAILFLASNASKFITGTIIPVDGGFSAFSGV